MSGDPLLVLDGLVQVFPQVSATAVIGAVWIGSAVDEFL
jgi:hypothetical protein